jgi:hypothetical protein
MLHPPNAPRDSRKNPRQQTVEQKYKQRPKRYREQKQKPARQREFASSSTRVNVVRGHLSFFNNCAW